MATANAKPKATASAPELSSGTKLLRLVILVALVAMIGAALDSRATAKLAFQAVVVELAATVLGIEWTRGRPAKGVDAPWPRVLRGAAFGAAAFAVALVASVGSGVRVVWAGVGVSGVVLGAIVAGVAALRDEILLRGGPLAVLGPQAPRLVRVLGVAAAGAAFAYGEGAHEARDLVFAGAEAAMFAVLWLRDDGAWLPFGAHTALRILRGPVFGGSLFGLVAGPSGRSPVTTFAWAEAAACVVVALVVTRRLARRRNPLRLVE